MSQNSLTPAERRQLDSKLKAVHSLDVVRRPRAQGRYKSIVSHARRPILVIFNGRKRSSISVEIFEIISVVLPQRKRYH